MTTQSAQRDTPQQTRHDTRTGGRRVGPAGGGVLLLLALLCSVCRIASGGTLLTNTASLPLEPPAQRPISDWLVHAPAVRAGVYRSPNGREITLNNGLIRRVFRLAPDAACVAFDNLMTDTALLRAVKPEAILELNGAAYNVGGLKGQPDLAYLRPEWLDKMTADPNAFHCTGYAVGRAAPRFPWKQTRHNTNAVWPPSGVSLTLDFAPPMGKLRGVTVQAHYEMYDGLPLVAKWLTLHNASGVPVRLNRFTSEQLGLVEHESSVEAPTGWQMPDITVTTDYTFGGTASRSVYWVDDPAYTTQVNYRLMTPCVLETRPPLGPDTDIAPGQSLDTFRTFELVHDSGERERKSLGIRRMYRALAPWITENPLMLHLTSTNTDIAHRAIDQCADVGFEMVIFSFGSGLNMEDTSPANIARFKALADYAHQRGIQIGGYSLLASRRIDDANDVINPKTGHTGGAIFDNSPCLGSQWGQAYFQHIQTFLAGTGFDLLEHDGSYPGDVCASTTHPGHRGLDDSQWTQYQQIAALYRWCRGRGIYLNVPDWYFLVGANKTAMGYRETNWSLPRAQQHVHARQNLFDGTWEKTPSMGWMFTPLVEYQGGGMAATIEPLREHLDDYERHLANNLGFGAQSCYRGPRLYDSPATRAVVTKWVAWFKAHRALLESDVIHLRRADGRGVDGVLHVNPALPDKGLAVFYNPTSQAVARDLVLPLHYTGLTGTALIREQDAPPRKYRLDSGGATTLRVRVPANAMTWFVIR